MPAAPISTPPTTSAAFALESKARREMVEAAGRLFQLLNLPRSIGQIYGLLYLASEPLTLDGIVEALQISKGSGSNGTRQLLAWGAIQRVWVPGERRDYFAGVGDLGALIRTSYSDYVKPRLKASEKRLKTMESLLDEDLEAGRVSEAEHRFCSERVRNLSALQEKLLSALPLVEKFL
jgi:DNA-binding transcriptional regulator GbsR (MarR family)